MSILFTFIYLFIYCVCCESGDGFLLLQIDKAYPRDFMQRGRVRVMLKREDGTFVNPAISSSKYSLI